MSDDEALQAVLKMLGARPPGPDTRSPEQVAADEWVHREFKDRLAELQREDGEAAT